MATAQIQPRFWKLRPCRREWSILWKAVIALAGSGLITAEAFAASPSGELAKDPARKLFTEHCQKCHSGPKHKGDFQIENLTEDYSDRKNRELWLAVRDQLESGEMPPKEKPHPPAHEVQTVIKWISERAGTAK